MSLRRLSISMILALPLPLCLAASLRAEVFESFTEPSRRIDVAPAETGVVAEVGVREGDTVAKGRIIASLDREVLLVVKEIAQATIDAVGRKDSARAEMELRKARLEKLRELRAAGHAGGEETHRAELDHTQAKGQHQAIEEQAKIDRLELRKIDAMLERRLVRSPIDGIVAIVHYDQGEFVTPVTPTVATIVQLDPLRAVFNLPYAAARNLKPSGAIEVRFPDDETSTIGKIEYIAPLIDADSGTVRVKILIDNPNQARPAGRRCTLSLDDPTTAQTADAATPR